jgi:serine protease Do
MKPIRSFLAVTTLCAASGVTGIVGYNMVQNVQFAHAAMKVEATRQQLHQAEDLSTVFRDISKVLSPSVVKIDVEKKVEGYHTANPFQQDPFLRRFFGPNGPNGMNPGGQDGPGDNDENGNGSDVQIGTGSGVIMDTEGDKAFIITNNHVAGGAEQLSVTLADGRKIDKENCKVVGTDPKTDLAVVEITADHVIAAKWGDSDELEQGDWVLAFGAPLGYVGSMTHGIISALHRTGVENMQGGYENFLQTDAPINPGNSGGPLVNLHGEVIGINTAIASQSGGFQGIGFAIPSNMVQNVYEQIKTKGRVTRGWLGVGIDDVTNERDVARDFGFTQDTGIIVSQIIPGTPAAGQLREGDIITELNGKTVSTRDELRSEIAKTAPGDEVNLKVFRDGKTQDVTIKIGEQPENLSMDTLRDGHHAGSPAPDSTTNLHDLGMRLSDLSDEQAQSMGLQNVQGALIVHVQANSAAARAGLTAGDIITRVRNTHVANAEEAQNALSKADLAKGVRLYVTQPDGSQRFVFIRTGQGE